MVGLRDDGGRRARRNPLPPHPGYHDRDGCRVAVGARRRWRGRDDRPRVDGAGVAPDRAPGGRPRHRTGVRAWDRVADAGGTEAGAGGSGRHGVKNGDRRVVVTGVGAVTPIGTAADGLWSGLTSRRSAVRGVTRFDPAPFRSRIAAEIPDFRPQDHLEAKRARRLDRFSQLAVTCARLAPLTFAAFSNIRAMSSRNDDPATASRPFDAERDGFVMGEGAAVVVLEERTRALARGAPIYAEVVGHAYTNDAYHMTAPRPDGRQAARAIQLALADGDVAPAEVGYINAHGSSTPLNDPTETAAIKQVFGDHAYRLTVSGTKGYYGHALGASGAIEAAICALALARGWLPPTINLERPDPRCDLDCLPGGGKTASPAAVVSNSFGFGGINAALVLRPDGGAR